MSDILSRLTARIEQGAPSTLTVQDLTRADFVAATTDNDDARFGWLTPRYKHPEDGCFDCWVLPICSDIISAQVRDLGNNELLEVYLSSISFFAYGHITYLLEGITEHTKRNVLIEHDAQDMPQGGDYLHLVSHVQMLILDSIGAQ